MSHLRLVPTDADIARHPCVVDGRYVGTSHPQAPEAAVALLKRVLDVDIMVMAAAMLDRPHDEYVHMLERLAELVDAIEQTGGAA